MTVSLIVCTRNRAAALGACLAAVAAIRTSAAWELVVVDNGSIDATRAVIDVFAAAADFSVHAVTQPVAGLSNARNAGLAAASGSLILFTDDDCYVDPGIIDATISAFADAAVGYASGRVRLFDPDDYPVTINESCTPLRLAAHSFIAAGTVKGANLAFRRSVLDAIGPFDPLFGSGALFPAEDADAAMRASLAGWDGVYDPAIIVWHHHGRKAGDAAALYRSYDLGRGAFHAKLLGLRGGLLPGLRAWAGLPRRFVSRPSLLWGELRGAGWYWWKRLAG